MNSETGSGNKNRSLFGKLKRPSQFSKPQLAIFVIVFGAIGYFIFHSFAASPLVTSLEAEQMTLPTGGSVYTDSTASGGKAVALGNTGSSGWATISGSVNFPSSVTSMSVVAKQSYCSGSPWLKVVLDGSTVWGGYLSSSSWAYYTANFSTAYKAGSHRLSISITNDTGRHSCDVNRYVDVTNFYGPTTVTPAPTVGLSASPATVTTGQSSTLTWTSTNATACAASGAWSGSEPTSGSVSTGAINQTSMYTLTCTGSGGSASASTTVGTNSPSPSVSISASPSSISSGQSSTLAWSATNATSCTASGAWSGSQATSGSLSVSPTTTSTYSLTCTGSGGSSTSSTTVSVSGSGLSLGASLFADEFNGPSGSQPAHDNGKTQPWDAKTYTTHSTLTWSGWDTNHISEDGTPQGNLVITATEDTPGNPAGHWHSGFISAAYRPYSGQRYIEARAKNPCGSGTWPAPVWEWAAPWGSGGLENDVIEQLGSQPTQYNVTLHNWDISKASNSYLVPSTHTQNLCGSWHTYGAAVYKDRIDFYLDRAKVQTILASEINATDLTAYSVVADIDLDMGGWAKTPTSDGPYQMLVDYIHVNKLN